MSNKWSGSSSIDSIVKKKMELKRKYKSVSDTAIDLAAKKMHRDATRNKSGESKSICWNCANAYGFCSWSADFIPVQGWEALETEYEGIRYTNSYVVYKCPEFEQEKPRKSTLPRLKDSELPLFGDMQVKSVYCETDDVYFRTILDCAKYIESRGDYDKGGNVYWILTARRSKGIRTVTIGNRVYRFLFPDKDETEGGF